jgi:hypothetical protein
MSDGEAVLVVVNRRVRRFLLYGFLAQDLEVVG